MNFEYICTAGGFVYPIVIVISGLSEDDLPINEFLVVIIKGIRINGHIDPRSKESGYICCIGSNVPQSQLFDYFYNSIIYPTLLE